MHQFSIITPSYNRAAYLPRIYDSLCQQKDIDFEWVIIHDGSTDNTRGVVSEFPKIFEIKYAYQNNAGKPSAMNLGTQMANSYISVSFDSDDILCRDVLKTVWSYFDINTGKFEHDCVCISGLCKYENGDIIGKIFPYDYYISDHIRYRHNKGLRGDKLEFVLTSVLKNYPFPIFNNEKNIAPGILMIRMALSHKTLYINHVFAEKQFLPGGLSTQNYWFVYTLGSELYYNEASIPPYKLLLQIMHSGKYIYFAKFNGKKNIYLNALNKHIFPLGIFYYFIFIIKLFLKKFIIMQKINDLIKIIFIKIFSRPNNYKVFKNG